MNRESLKKVVFMGGILLTTAIGLSLMACSSDDNNNKDLEDNPFIGEWHTVSVEGGEVDYPEDIKTVTFYKDGRFTFSPLISLLSTKNR